MTHNHDDIVFIKNLTLEMFVGIYNEEKTKKQRVIVNVTMYVDSNLNKRLNNINDVVSYEKIVNTITNIATQKHYDLLEEFAETIAQTCLLETKIQAVRIKAEKPDIIVNTKSVGIEIIRRK